MKNRSIAAILVLFCIISLFSCQKKPLSKEERAKEIYSIYEEVIEKYGPYYQESPDSTGWPYSYHPMIYAAWRYKGEGKPDPGLESKLEKGNETYMKLRDELIAQLKEGLSEFDTDRLINVVDDEKLRSKMRDYIDEGLLPLDAFTRAFIEPLAARNPNLPEKILVRLGKVYTDRPELIEVPKGSDNPDENKNWRDWLHLALGACGETGVRAILDFDDELQSLQEMVPGDDFWKGRLSIAYNLRSIQYARASALDLILEALSVYRNGGKVSGLHSWMYYDLGWTLGATGGMFPYTPEDYSRVSDFLDKGFLEGPIGDGEEAWAIADTLGRAPTYDLAEKFIKLIDDPNLECERKLLCYKALGGMYFQPIETWEQDEARRIDLRERAVGLIEKGGLQCGNIQVVDFISSFLGNMITENGETPTVGLTDEEFLGIHDAVIRKILPELKTPEEQVSAINLFSWALLQLDFIVAHPTLSYRNDLIAVRDIWKANTDFQNSAIDENTYKQYMDYFNSMIGEENYWQNK